MDRSNFPLRTDPRAMKLTCDDIITPIERRPVRSFQMAAFVTTFAEWAVKSIVLLMTALARVAS